MFHYLLSHEIARAVRYRNFFSVCVMGLDAGRPEGRTGSGSLVRVISGALGEKLRSTDAIGVLEPGFGVILLHVSDQPARRVAERLSSHVREVAIPSNDMGHEPREPVVVSVGGACFPRHGQTTSALLSHALECLQTARQLGGNRVVYDPAEP